MSSIPLRVAIIGGTGLAQELGGEGGRTEFPDTPFGKPSAPIVVTRWKEAPDIELLILQRHGIGHVIPPGMLPSRANIFALKLLGATHVIASGATGSLRESIHPGQLVIADQVIDRTSRRPCTYYERAAVHVEFSEPFCPVMRRWLLDGASRLEGVTVHGQGVYVCMEGPAFSTRAESHMHRQWGGDLIGMTVMPEAKLAREAELPYALIALPTDYDCWRAHTPPPGVPMDLAQQELLKEIIANLKRASFAGLTLIKAALRRTDILREHRSPAADALKMAIWSDKNAIDRAEVDRLRPLWGRYFA